MYTNTKLNDEIVITELLHNLFEAYEEIAVMQMKKIRNQVLSARQFVFDVQDVYSTTKYIYSKRMRNKMHLTTNAQTDKLSFSTLTKNGKVLSIFISPKERFSGDIGYKVFDKYYLENFKKKFKDDLMIIGFFGKQLLLQRNREIKYKYYDIKTLKGANFEKLIKDINAYETVEVYFGKFENLLYQKPDMINLMEGVKGHKLKIEGKSGSDYIFEPSIEGVMHFFEIEMTKAFFKQCLSESELSRYGSRMTAMEIASYNAKEHIKSLNRKKILLDKSLSNRKQLERLSGISLFNLS